MTLLIIISVLLFLKPIFSFFSSPKVIEITPPDLNEKFEVDQKIIIKFDKPLKRQAIQFSVSPETLITIQFEDPIIENHLFKTIVLTPALKFQPGTEYSFSLKNIQGFGFNQAGIFNFSFKTQEDESNSQDNNLTLIKIPFDWQDFPLSCEAASLKMALSSKSFFISENEILEEFGLDSETRKIDIWGDPYQSFVGDPRGKICQTGYGVYWPRVAETAQRWRPAEAFSGWQIEKLTKEIKAGNPVIVWGVLPEKPLTDCSWYTKEGKYILAFKETHVRLVIGFVGPEDKPAKIIINDPLAGRLFWPTDYFLKNWQTFNYSGVVVR